MKRINRIAKAIAVTMIVAILAIPFSVFGAQMKQGSDFWYSIGNVKGETFTVDGHTAYCVNPLLPIPNSGNYTAKQINNVSLLKVLYYGYGGIGFNNTTKAKMDSYHNNQNITASGKDLYYGLTRRCAARAYGSNYKFDYYPDWNTAIDAMYTYFQSKNTPVGCKLYIINQNSSSLNDDGSVTEVNMRDDVTKVEVVKVNGKNQPLAGVELQILDKGTNEVVVPTWTTDGNPYRIDGKLIVGKTYLLHEVKALPNYKPADDVEFTVEDTSTVQQVKMINVLSTGSVTLKKRDDQNGSLAGSQWQLFTADDKAISVTKTDDGIYQFDESGQLQTMDTDQTGKLNVGSLPLGDYYFVESKAAEGTMPYAKKVPFTVSENTLNPEVTVKDYKTVSVPTANPDGSGTAITIFAPRFI